MRAFVKTCECFQTWFSNEVVRWRSQQTAKNSGVVEDHSVYEAIRRCNPSNCLLQASTYVISNYFRVP